jgi:hypothetical protein
MNTVVDVIGVPFYEHQRLYSAARYVLVISPFLLILSLFVSWPFNQLVPALVVIALVYVLIANFGATASNAAGLVATMRMGVVLAVAAFASASYHLSVDFNIYPLLGLAIVACVVLLTLRAGSSVFVREAFVYDPATASFNAQHQGDRRVPLRSIVKVVERDTHIEIHHGNGNILQLMFPGVPFVFFVSLGHLFASQRRPRRSSLTRDTALPDEFSAPNFSRFFKRRGIPYAIEDFAAGPIPAVANLTLGLALCLSVELPITRYFDDIIEPGYLAALLTILAGCMWITYSSVRDSAAAAEDAQMGHSGRVILLWGVIKVRSRRDEEEPEPVECRS